MKKLRHNITFKSLSGIVILLLIFSVIVTTMGYLEFTRVLEQQYSEEAFHTAFTAALEVDGNRIAAYAESGGTTEEYENVRKRLDLLCNSTDSTFIYVITPDRSDYGHITFLFSTQNRKSPYDPYEFGYVRETTNDEYREKYRALYDGTTGRELVIRDKGYIETDPHITAMVPIRNAGNAVKAILCVQRQMDILSAARRTYVRKVYLIMLILAAVVTLGQWLYLKKVLLEPLKKIIAEAGRFAAENVRPKRKLGEVISNRDEIGMLAWSIDRMEDQVVDYVENLTKVTAEKERIGTELALAKRIQAGMLPNLFPAFPDREEFDIYATMNPAKEVGGDFYDFFLIDHDHLGMVIADVSGKGVPAALFMMASKILLYNYSISGRRPSEILAEVNTQICAHDHEDMFVTVWLGILDLTSGKLTAANAGHEYPVLRDPGGSFAFVKDKHGFVLGGMENMKYQDYELQLSPGTRLFLYTDGVTEAENEDVQLFGMERLLAALNKKPDGTPQEILDTVHEEVSAFVGEAAQFDDLTRMCLQYNGRESS